MAKPNMALARRLREYVTKSVRDSIVYELCESDTAGFGDWLMHDGDKEYSISAKKQGNKVFITADGREYDEDSGEPTGGELAKFELVISLKPIG